MKLLLFSARHPRARVLPEQVWAEVEAADVVVHAGDWVDVALLDELEERSKRLIGVYGNNDGPPLRARLPGVARVGRRSGAASPGGPLGPGAPGRSAPTRRRGSPAVR